MDREILQLIESAKSDYARFSGNPERIAKFAEGFLIKKGRKYIKICHNGAAWAFIVNTHKDEIFAKGDILKPACWASPIRNRQRGNVYHGDSVNWTGPAYISHRGAKNG